MARFTSGVHRLLTERIIGAAIEVHRELGPGLLESAYEKCLCYELRSSGIPFRSQVRLPLVYKGATIDAFGYRLDLLIDDLVIVEVKAVDRLIMIHKAQMLTYLQQTGARVGLVLNFNAAVLRDGIVRISL